MPSRLAARTLLRQRFALLLMTIALPAAAILPLLPALPASASSTPTLLGEQSWYTLDRHQLWDKADLAVNVASGDLIFHEKDLGIPGIGANNLILERYYNSLSNGAGGGADFGSDWVMTAGGDVKLTIVAGVSATFQGPSSFQQVFPANGSAWTTPAGMDANLVGLAGGPYTLTYHNNGQVLTFNGTGQLQSNADRNGNTIRYTYNPDGTLQLVTDATGRQVSFTYNGGGNVATMVDKSLSPNRVYNYSVNGSHNLFNYVDPANPLKVTTLTYDTGGKHELVDILDPAGNGETKLTYDTSHRVTQLQFVKDSLGGTYNRLYAYNSGTGTCTVSPAPAGNTVVTDENNHTTTYCWDTAGRVVQRLDAMSPADSTITVWNSDNKPTSIQDARGFTTQYQYTDSFALNENLTAVIQPTEGTQGGATTTYVYGATTNHYAPTMVTQPQGTSFSYTYDTNGNQATMVNGLSSQNTVTKVSLSNGLLYFTLNAKGVVAPGCFNVSTPMSECYQYDANGALNYKLTPTGIDRYTNDGASRVATHTDGNSNVDTYTYDADDRVLQIAYGTTNTCPTASVSCTTFVYDADGNLMTLKDQTGTSTFTQDKLNRPLTETKSGSAMTTYTFDGVGNLTKLVNAAGTTSYGYDPADRLTSMTDPALKVIQFLVDANGNRYKTTYPNAHVMGMGYDNSSRQSGISDISVPSSWSYTYTAPGNHDANLRYSAHDGIANTTSTYSYDALGRLAQVVPPSGPTQYTSYDANSNNCGRTDGSACQGGTADPFRYNAADQLSYQNGLSYTYWGDGTMKTWGNGTDSGALYPNVQGQLGQVTHGSLSTTYTYRGVGQADRATATSSYFGNQTWTSDLLGVSTETNTNATLSGCPCYYIHDTSGTLIEEVLTSGTQAGSYFPDYDGSGSVIALTNSSGAVVDTWTYNPTGLASSTGTVYEPWQFQGQYMDQTGGTQSNQATGSEQYHSGARYREAGWMAGTWGQQDPLDSPFDTQGWNRYNYAGQNAVNLSDPNGMGGAPGCGSVGRPCNPNVFGANFLWGVTNGFQRIADGLPFGYGPLDIIFAGATAISWSLIAVAAAGIAFGVGAAVGVGALAILPIAAGGYLVYQGVQQFRGQ